MLEAVPSSKLATMRQSLEGVANTTFSPVWSTREIVDWCEATALYYAIDAELTRRKPVAKGVPRRGRQGKISG